MPFADSGGLKIYYETHGDGPCIVFVHGAGGSHAAWWQQTAYLKQFFRVVTLDLRGFGNSDSVSDGPDALDFPNDVLAVLAAADVRAGTLIGQSIGAVAALRAAIADPSRVKAVILAHSLGGLAHPELTPLVRADRANAEKLSVLDRLLTKDFQRGDPAKTFLFQQIGTFNQAKMQDLRNVAAAGPSIEDVVRAGVRICFLAGEKDAVLSVATVRKAHAVLANSTLAVVPNAPHSMYWEAPALFNQAVHGLLQQIYPEAFGRIKAAVGA
jgi:pimeloyl-ACP methyl ester carboxylesterase